MDKVRLKLMKSESIVASSAAQIFSAYIIAGKVQEGQEEKWINKAVEQAIKLTVLTDDLVCSDHEMH